MTKRALIIISILLILPIVITLISLIGLRLRNPVVAKWSEDAEGIIYKGESYLPVGEAGERLFAPGKYLGRIGDSHYGSPLYLVSGDRSGYLCYAYDGDTLILLSRTGKPLDGIPSGGAPSCIKLGKTTTDDRETMALLLSLDELTDPAQFTDDDDLPIDLNTEKYKGKYTKYKIWEYWGETAIGLDSGARLYHMDESGNWYYVTAEDARAAEADPDEVYHTYTARPLRDPAAISLIERLTSGEAASAESDTEAP